MPLEIVRADITAMRVDAVVAPTDSAYSGRGGADAAIHRAAGPELDAACRRLPPCAPGQAEITRGYELPCKWILHTVGPVWQGGDQGEEETLAGCYRSCLRLAWKKRCRSVAFPLVSSGTFGFPKGCALRIAGETIREFLLTREMTVFLVVYDRESLEISEQLYSHVARYIEDVYTGEEDLERSAFAAPTDAGSDYGALHSIDIGELLADETAAYEAMPGRPEAASRRTTGQPKRLENVSLGGRSLEEALRELDEGFSEAVLRLIDDRGMTDVECYKRANLDRKLFSKLRSDRSYRPSKRTALALAVALRLDPEETDALLRKAGFALSRSSKADVIVEYFLSRGQWDIMEINQALFAFDQMVLGG